MAQRTSHKRSQSKRTGQTAYFFVILSFLIFFPPVPDTQTEMTAAAAAEKDEDGDDLPRRNTWDSSEIQNFVRFRGIQIILN